MHVPTQIWGFQLVCDLRLKGWPESIFCMWLTLLTSHSIDVDAHVSIDFCLSHHNEPIASFVVHMQNFGQAERLLSLVFPASFYSSMLTASVLFR